MNQLFVIVQRNINNEVHIEYTSNVLEAIYKQKALLVGCPVEMVKATISEKEITEVINRLNTNYRDRLYNSEEEVTIVFFPKKNI